MSQTRPAWKMLPVFFLCTLRFGIGWRPLILFAFLYILSLITFEDMDTRRIPDRLVLAVLAVSVLSVPFFPEIGWRERLLGIFSVSGPLLAVGLVRPGGFGGGDIKLMGACGLFLGWELILRSFVLAMTGAGLWCVFMLAAGKLTGKSGIALGPFLCLGMGITVFWRM